LKTTAQALHAPTFLINRQQHVRAQPTNCCAQLTYLARRFDIPGKQNHTTYLGLAKNLPILGTQPGSGDIQHQRALQGFTHFISSSAISHLPAHCGQAASSINTRQWAGTRSNNQTN
jgi:hypothetical protein